MNDMPNLEMAMVVASLAMLNRKRKNLSPEDAAKREEREALAKEALFDAQYAQAHIDHEEYKRSPRAFLRRLYRSKGGES